VTPRRTVRVGASFFDDLDAALPSERSTTGTPSTADFLLYEMPLVIERLATDLEGSTTVVAGADDVRLLITSGLLVRHIAAYAIVLDDGSVDLVALEIER
jgi:hypothetical protein